MRTKQLIKLFDNGVKSLWHLAEENQLAVESFGEDSDYLSTAVRCDDGVVIRASYGAETAISTSVSELVADTETLKYPFRGAFSDARWYCAPLNDE